jgi:hypothetical protein
LLVGNGFADDLFPIAESLRFANRLRTLHPRAPLELWYFDFGHQRGSNKPPDRARLLAAIHAWFDYYVRGSGRRPGQGVTAMTQTCPRSALSGGPFTATTFAQLARGDVRRLFRGSQTITDSPGNPQVGEAIDPIVRARIRCRRPPAAATRSSARRRSPPR